MDQRGFAQRVLFAVLTAGCLIAGLVASAGAAQTQQAPFAYKSHAYNPTGSGTGLVAAASVAPGGYARVGELGQYTFG